MAIRRACECFLFFLLIALTACIGPGPAEKPPLETEGEVVVYLEPLPQSARHLRFDFDFVTALGPGGASFPLSLYQKIVSGKDLLDRQKRLAAGPLPPGTYSGLPRSRSPNRSRSSADRPPHYSFASTPAGCCPAASSSILPFP